MSVENEKMERNKEEEMKKIRSVFDRDSGSCKIVSS
jgi:hypothetical protein